MPRKAADDSEDDDDDEDDVESDSDAEEVNYDELESRRTSCLAGLAFASGLLLIVVAAAGLRSQAIGDVDRLVIFNALWPTYSRSGLWREVVAQDLMAMTTRRILRVLVGTSIVVMLAALLGIAGARTQRKGLVCTYTLVASVLAAFTLVAAAECCERRAIAVPLIHRQVTDLCNATRYIRLGKQLNCSWASAYESHEVAACGAVCSFRAKVLARLDGCELLPKLCKRFEYAPMSGEACAGALADLSEGYGGFAGPQRCQRECDADILCDSVAVQEGLDHCLLLSGRGGLHQPPQWQQIPQAANVSAFFDTPPLSSAAGAGHGSHSAVVVTAGRLAGAVECRTRGTPQTLVDFESVNTRLVIATSLLGLVLSVSLVCTCCQMYNINMRRQGRATATELMLMLLCPCLAEDLHHRFHGAGVLPDFPGKDSPRPRHVASRQLEMRAELR